MNKYKKCLQKNLGKKNYKRLRSIRAEDQMMLFKTRGKVPLKELRIFAEMKRLVETMKKEEAEKGLERMRNAMTSADAVLNYFRIIFLEYMGGNLILILLKLNYFVTCASLILMGICFIYKAWEYACNRYCYLDQFLSVVYVKALQEVFRLEL